MTALVFVDTNVLVYSRSASEARKQARAAAWLDHLWTSRRGRVSVQVLQEFYVTATRKLNPRMDVELARADVRNLMAWRPVPTDGTLLERAWTVEHRYRLSFWDSLIVAAAKASGCAFLLTEDLQANQELDGLRIVDPFTAEPASID